MMENAIRTLQAENSLLKAAATGIVDGMDNCTLYSHKVISRRGQGKGSFKGMHPSQLAFDGNLDTYAQVDLFGDIMEIHFGGLRANTFEVYQPFDSGTDHYRWQIDGAAATEGAINHGGWVSIPVPASGVVNTLTISGIAPNGYFVVSCAVATRCPAVAAV